MKTPMQELLGWVRATQPLPSINTRMIIQEIQSLLEKEKEVMCGIYDDALARVDRNYIGGEGEQYFEETFKTKEK